MQELQKSSYSLLEGILVPTGHVAQVHPCGNMRLEIAPPQFREDLGHIVCEESVASGVILRTDFGHFPAWQIGMDTVQKCRILQLDGKYLEQMPIVRCWLTLCHISVDIPTEHYRTLRRKP